MTQIAIKSGKQVIEQTVPVTREWLESKRAEGRQWLKDHVRPGIESDGLECGAARSALGIDDMKISGFDKLILGMAVTAKRIKYL